MPELPDVELYLHALRRRLTGIRIRSFIIKSPFVVRTFEIDISGTHSQTIHDCSRIGKRIVWHLDDELLVVFHLMITGRFHLRKAHTFPRTKFDLAAIQFEDFTLMLTEAATKKRASIHLVRGEASLEQFRRGGLNVLTCSFDEFKSRICMDNRTVKLALIDPTKFDGIGNAYSDEILHHARCSPFQRTGKLTSTQMQQLFESCRNVLRTWADRLIEQHGNRFPEKVTAFRPEMAVHGKFGEPCPVCVKPVQRIVFADKQWNYCAQCQTGGRLLADRSLSRLLRDEWPSTIDEI